MRGEAALTVRRTYVVGMPPLMGVVQARARRAHAQRRAAREADKRRGERREARSLGCGGPDEGVAALVATNRQNQG